MKNCAPSWLFTRIIPRRTVNKHKIMNFVSCETGIGFRHRLQGSRLKDWGLLRQDAVQVRADTAGKSIYEPTWYYLIKGKVKSVPLQAWSGPEGSWKLRFPDFMTTAQDGGKVVSLTHWPPLPPGNAPGTHFC